MRKASGKTRPTTARRVLSTAVAGALTLCMLGGAVGCKPTDKLTERIWDQSAEQVDYDSPQKNWVYKPKAEEQDRSARTLTKEETELMEEQDDDFTPDEEDGNEEEPSYDRKKSKSKKKTSGRTSTTTSNEGDNSAGGDESGGTADSEGDGEGDTAAGAGDTSSTGESTEGTGDDSTGGGEDSAGNNEEAARNQGNSGSESTGGAGGAAQVYNDTTYTKLPEDAATVAATGDYALIVCMLAGGDDSHKSPLVAADEEFLSGKAMKAFADEGVTTKRVKQGWSGDGTKSGEADVKAIIKADPDVVLVGTDDASLSQDEADQLTAKGIDVVVMPRMGQVCMNDSDIVTAVNVVGALLDGANTLYDTKDMASKYEEFHDSVIDYDVAGSIPNKNGGYCTGWSHVWRNSRLTTVSQIGPSGNEISVTGKVAGTYYMTIYADRWAHFNASRIDGMDVSDGVGITTPNDHLAGLGGGATDYSPLVDYYLSCGGVDDDNSPINGIAGAPFAAVDILGSSHSQHVLRADDEKSIQYGRYRATDVINALDAQATFGSSNQYEYRVGQSYYPGIVVRNEAMARAVVSSAAKSDGAWHTGKYPQGSTGYGNQFSATQYDVYVMPSGVGGDWADGSVESFLTCPWINATYLQTKDYGECTEQYVQEFYQRFYRADYTDLLDGYGDIYVAHSAS